MKFFCSFSLMRNVIDGCCDVMGSFQPLMVFIWNNWINKASYVKRKAQIGKQINPFSNRSRCNRSSSTRKTKLKKPRSKLLIIIFTNNKKVFGPYEPTINISISKRIAPPIPNKTTYAGIYAVFQHRVLIIFESHLS